MLSSILGFTDVSWPTASYTLAQTDTTVPLTLQTTNTDHVGTYTVQLSVKWDEYPELTLTSQDFVVNIYPRCLDAIVQAYNWSAGGTAVTQDYHITAGPVDHLFAPPDPTYLTAAPQNPLCTVVYDLIVYDSTADNWSTYTDTLVTKTVDHDTPTYKVTIDTVNLLLDQDTIPVTQKFGLCASTPDLLTASGTTTFSFAGTSGALPTWTTPTNPLCIGLDITWMHPCRYAVLNDITTFTMTSWVLNADDV